MSYLPLNYFARCGRGLLVALWLVGAWTACGRDVTQFYALNCANCHGKNLEGGQAASLLDDEWKHGSDDASLARSISEGFPTNGMPAWKGTLDEAEVRAMVVFIREKATQAKRGQLVFAKPVSNEPVKSRQHTFRLVSVTEQVKTPWGMAFLPDGRMLVTEKQGQLRIVAKNGVVSEPVAGTPQVWSRSQGGLLDVALSPGFASNGWIYLSFSHPLRNPTNGPAMTSIVRGRIQENRWVDEQVIYRAQPDQYKSAGVHFGSRLVFDGAGNLFFTIGERGSKEDAQDLTRPNGKVHRVKEDGSIPADNPFLQVSNAVPSLWTYGNRNPQGLARNPVNGDLWAVEHGPRGGDELNLIRRGLNYGWPVITYGMDYNGSPISALTAKEGMEQPVTYWTPSIAVCDLEFYTGKAFPGWRGDLFATALAQQELRRIVLDGQRVKEQEVLFKDIGRVRAVITGPDGCLYVALNQPDKIVRVEPAP